MRFELLDGLGDGRRRDPQLLGRMREVQMAAYRFEGDQAWQVSLTHLPAQNPTSRFASMRGHHVAVRVPNAAAAKRWYVEKLDFHILHEWPYADQNLAYVGQASDDHFYVEILGDGSRGPIPKLAYADLGDSLRLAGYHHFCLSVDDLDATVAELRRRDIAIVTEPFDPPVSSCRLAFFADL